MYLKHFRYNQHAGPNYCSFDNNVISNIVTERNERHSSRSGKETRSHEQALIEFIRHPRYRRSKGIFKLKLLKLQVIFLK
jgi:hypothetical protein